MLAAIEVDEIDEVSEAIDLAVWAGQQMDRGVKGASDPFADFPAEANLTEFAHELQMLAQMHPHVVSIISSRPEPIRELYFEYCWRRQRKPRSIHKWRKDLKQHALFITRRERVDGIRMTTITVIPSVESLSGLAIAA